MVGSPAARVASVVLAFYIETAASMRKQGTSVGEEERTIHNSSTEVDSNDEDLNKSAWKWILGQAGESCTAVCSNYGRSCTATSVDNQNKLAPQDLTYSISTMTNSAFACGVIFPLVESYAPAYASPQRPDDAKGWCGFKSSAASTCDARDPTFWRVCSCEAEACDETLSSGDWGFGYRGCQTKTRSGLTCQKWTVQWPHTHTVTLAKHPHAGLGGEHNYCRNPDGEGSIWCYTTDPDKRWDFCNPKVPMPAHLRGRWQDRKEHTFYGGSILVISEGDVYLVGRQSPLFVQEAPPFGWDLVEGTSKDRRPRHLMQRDGDTLRITKDDREWILSRVRCDAGYTLVGPICKKLGEWILGESGESCGTVCGKVGRKCTTNSEKKQNNIKREDVRAKFRGLGGACRVGGLSTFQFAPYVHTDGRCVLQGKYGASTSKCGSASRIARRVCYCELQGKQCQSWCHGDRHPWVDKCSWEDGTPCSGCTECSEVDNE